MGKFVDVLQRMHASNQCNKYIFSILGISWNFERKYPVVHGKS
jgi:hypothetical protein